MKTTNILLSILIVVLLFSNFKELIIKKANAKTTQQVQEVVIVGIKFPSQYGASSLPVYYATPYENDVPMPVNVIRQQNSKTVQSTK